MFLLANIFVTAIHLLANNNAYSYNATIILLMKWL